jgi:hypothetical protein
MYLVATLELLITVITEAIMTTSIKSTEIEFESFLDKVRSPSTRAGNTIERVGKLSEAGVSHRVIAAQMEENTRLDVRFSEGDIKVITKVWQCSKSNVLITKNQSKALIQDQLESSPNSVEIAGFAL